jgi:hypothetical protein
MAFNSHTGGYIYSRGAFGDKWDAAVIPAADLYSNWIRVDSKEGYLTFHYKLSNTDWVGVLKIEAHNDPDESGLGNVAVTLSSGTTSLNIPNTTDANNEGIISVSKRARYYRMFLDRTSGSDTGNTITCQVHQ